jgi:hypothetical protein
MVTKRFAEGWLPAYSFEVGLGEPVGDVVVVDTPWKKGIKQNINLKTPYVLEKIIDTSERIFNYEIRASSDGQGGKVLSSKALSRGTSEYVVLRNAVTGTTENLIKLEKLLRVNPDTPTRITVYPFAGGVLNELDSFSKDPAAFKQPIMEVVAPIMHEPGKGPIVAVQQKVLNMPVSPYFELPDGRLLYIDPLNDAAITVTYRAGIEPAPEQLPATEGGK